MLTSALRGGIGQPKELSPFVCAQGLGPGLHLCETAWCG